MAKGEKANMTVQQYESILFRLRALEANSRNAASSDQPIVGPPSLSEDSRALARPVCLTEVEAILKDEIELAEQAAKSQCQEFRVCQRLKTILQRLTSLDQGPAAQKPASRGMAEPPYKPTSLGS